MSKRGSVKSNELVGASKEAIAGMDDCAGEDVSDATESVGIRSKVGPRLVQSESRFPPEGVLFVEDG